jgi:hypothetical protein
MRLQGFGNRPDNQFQDGDVFVQWREVYKLRHNITQPQALRCMHYICLSKDSLHHFNKFVAPDNTYFYHMHNSLRPEDAAYLLKDAAFNNANIRITGEHKRTVANADAAARRAKKEEKKRTVERNKVEDDVNLTVHVQRSQQDQEARYLKNHQKTEERRRKKKEQREVKALRQEQKMNDHNHEGPSQQV